MIDNINAFLTCPKCHRMYETRVTVCEKPCEYSVPERVYDEVAQPLPVVPVLSIEEEAAARAEEARIEAEKNG